MKPNGLVNIRKKGLGVIWKRYLNVMDAPSCVSGSYLYAHYRVGEFYENGWGTEKNIEEAKRYYRLAYKERHDLAIKKLQTFDFLH